MPITNQMLSEMKEPLLQKLLFGDMLEEKEIGRLEVLTELQKELDK